jgi:hypothetical protein
MTPAQSKPLIGFLLLGGIHHILHLIPPASELGKAQDVKVIIFVRNKSEKMMCEDILRRLGMANPDIKILKAAPWLGAISPKLSVLISNLRQFEKLDALIVAERTSTLLRYWPGKRPIFIHIPHGAGDREKSYDPRLRHFDHILVAGEKDKTRMIEKGVTRAENCYVTGYIKPYVVRALDADLPALFETDRPVVLYNPHFDETLSSWNTYGFELLDHFAKTPRFNFVFAPHIRLFSKASETIRARILAYKKHPNIHIDLGSARSTDMTYTRFADIYLGDVSSQVYEFLSKPKPCVFIGAETTPWHNNPDYAHWRYGQVCHTSEAVMSALETAFTDHETYRELQIKGCRAAMGDPNWNPVKRASDRIRSILGR